MKPRGLSSGERTAYLRIQRPVADDSFDGAGSGAWVTVDDVWANVQDMLPSRGERIADGVNVSARPARVRMLYRPDITLNMRFLLLDHLEGVEVIVRVMQIVSGPAELGRRDGLEFVVEEYSPAGNPA